MKRRTEDVFDAAVRRWLQAWQKRAPQHECDLPAVLQAIRDRLPADVRHRIGAGYLRRVVADAPERRYVIGALERGRELRGRLQMISTARGNRAGPCWESFVHAAEYVSLRAMADHLSEVRVVIEDPAGSDPRHAMDLGVYFGRRFVAYCEVKEASAGADTLEKALLEAVKFPVRERRVANEKDDGVKKANYILDKIARNEALGYAGQSVWFSIRAGGPKSAPIDERVFEIRAHGDRRIEMVRLDRPLPFILEEAVDPGRRAQARLAWAVERASAECWVSRGVVRGSYNVYRSTATGDHILLGMMADGRVFTEPAALGVDGRERLEAALEGAGLALGRGRAWTYLRDGDGQLRLDDATAERIEVVLLGVLKQSVA